MRRTATLALSLTLACTPAATDHETLGDQRYGAGRFRDALAEYALALQARPTAPDLLAKAGIAAMNSGELPEAVQHFGALAEADESRSEEAATGLWLVVQAAQAGDPALTAAIRMLRTVAPEYPIGNNIKELALAEVAAGAGQAGDLLLQAAASVEGQVADSLLFAYGQLAARRGRCDEAVEVFDGLVRRRRAPEVEEGARTGAARCALREGRVALAAGDLPRAEGYLKRATSPAAPREIARAAWLGLGEVALARADTQAAIDALHEAVAGRAATADSIARVASDYLDDLFDSEGL